ncbi:gliding motility lipoprotein GldD [Flavobacterium filum]|uniref:gliding motility lipoprotein GldD n=1 Tax=Flavobacterium filum TaxID=370974 RepID=UPI00040135AB|nr:gliding motility lipoprotein GldD [Flavobacterium filum]
MNKIVKLVCLSISFLLLWSCKEELLPKPNALLRLDYQLAQYERFDSPCAYQFDYNIDANLKVNEKCDITIQYPKMKATVYLTYRKVNNNINDLLKDAQKLTYEHVIKADEIVETPFINTQNKVYGMFYQVGGNAATNTQFYATDSINHFVTGSVYFYTKPNFDSIMPAASYIKDDMKTLLETMSWKK